MCIVQRGLSRSTQARTERICRNERGTPPTGTCGYDAGRRKPLGRSRDSSNPCPEGPRETLGTKRAVLVARHRAPTPAARSG